ncbi:sulfite exporter TauE/SafE family protein [Novosphingobium sp. LASN5T]|uniref:sulfite exporter TauE/SafE family protein n=1 Tax=Novosphingobium sp. LASN5T TaxID=2491021 RepID=UPI000F5EF0AD|nr:sulfite exporter TauE/SafE family protein [Novosphingobium sp. LASN5T]RQW43584.1 sulfite exporter TauE/SafE family protein [Novosphingobium sp. LASN5T]
MDLQLVESILPFVAVGFLAQLVDGALGMAFGVITNTLLISVLGVAPARASASVHIVECFTTAASGISHIAHGNVDWRLFGRLVVPGTIGGIAAAYLLSSIDAGVARPFVMAYLACIGVYLIWRAWEMGHHHVHKAPRYIAPLGMIGGFLDAAGGGGWGPVVTSNLLVQGSEPRRTIGTVNASEFVLTLTISATFLVALGAEAFTKATIGLIIGGLLAAPIGALLVKRVSAKWLLGMVGVVLVTTSVFSVTRVLMSG